jgi:hypothetical protein
MQVMLPSGVAGCLTELVNSVDLPNVLAALAIGRPVFHPEADFQLAFAWELQRAHPSARIRLETRPARGRAP